MHVNVSFNLSRGRCATYHDRVQFRDEEVVPLLLDVCSHRFLKRWWLEELATHLDEYVRISLGTLSFR